MPKVPLIMHSALGDRYAEQQASLLGVSSIISKSEPAITVVAKSPEPAHSNGCIACFVLAQAAESIFVMEGGSCFSCSFPALLIFANS
jgi:hypothetical protein